MITLTRGFFLSRYVLPLAEPRDLSTICDRAEAFTDS